MTSAREGGGGSHVKIKGLSTKLIFSKEMLMKQQGECCDVGVMEIKPIRKGNFNYQDARRANTEDALSSEGLLEDDDNKHPLRVSLTSEFVDAKCRVMDLLNEFTFLFKELLIFGGADLTIRPDDDSEGTNGTNGKAANRDTGVIWRDLNGRLAKTVAVFLKILEKNMESKNFHFRLNGLFRLFSKSENDLIVEIIGQEGGNNNAGGTAEEDTPKEAEDDFPMLLEWSTTFVDVVEDFKAVTAELRKGSVEDEETRAEERSTTEGGGGGGMWSDGIGGNLARAFSPLKSKGRRESLKKFFGMKRSSSSDSGSAAAAYKM